MTLICFWQSVIPSLISCNLVNLGDNQLILLTFQIASFDEIIFLNLSRSTSFIFSAVPEVSVNALNDNHEFIVLACDGIWDVMSSQEVVDFIRPKIAAGQGLDMVSVLLMSRVS